MSAKNSFVRVSEAEQGDTGDRHREICFYTKKGFFLFSACACLNENGEEGEWMVSTEGFSKAIFPEGIHTFPTKEDAVNYAISHFKYFLEGSIDWLNTQKNS